MPRQARLDVPGLVHHVMARGIEGREIYRDDDDREAFLSRLGEVVQEAGARLYAWALLSNHFHLVLRPEDRPLAWIMRRLMTGHAVRFNVRHRRKGHLFQNRYKSIVVEEEEYFLQLVRYVFLNPVRAGLVQDMAQLGRYPYSGHAVVVGAREFPAQDTDTVLLRFSERRPVALRVYEDFISAGFGEGVRQEFRGGGLVRSAGGWERLARRKPEEREAADERILGAGEFVESVLRGQEVSARKHSRNLEEVLAEVCERHGMDRNRLLGPARDRQLAKVRRAFFLRAHEEAGAGLSQLARLTGRSHMAVSKAIAQARSEQGGAKE